MKKEMYRFYTLPDDILRLIFSFDSTYKEYFSSRILPSLPHYCTNISLFLRVKEIVEKYLEEYTDFDMQWYAQRDCDKSLIKIVIRETEMNLYAKFYVSHVKHTKHLSRFVSLSLNGDNEGIYRNEMNHIEMYFVQKVLPMILTYKHNLIVANHENEYFYYSLTHEKNTVSIYKDQVGQKKVGSIVGGRAHLFLETGFEIGNRLYTVEYCPRHPI
jgi:hypothetical protein